MKDFKNKVAVITGAGSGFGREFARIAADRGMRLVLADVQADALKLVVDELRTRGAHVIGEQVDVSKAEQVEHLANRTYSEFGASHLLFNNAGVASGGLIWESSLKDWEWVMGVNVMGVVHGIHFFIPRMITQGDQCHVVNTASVAGLLSAQTMGVYNVSKHSVVTLSETLFHDLRVSESKIGVSVLCPAFVPTGISESHRNRPSDLANDAPLTDSQRAAQQASSKAVSSGKITAQSVAETTFSAVEANQFYIVTHAKIMQSVHLRLDDVRHLRNPSDPFAYKPDAAYPVK
jgi:NADP-dependent 3-hydroxy acid dehydrogenase YdfG